MDNSTLTHGFNAEVKPWRPWINTRRSATHKPYERPEEPRCKLALTHPVKLFWPKSQCFDYLYRDAEILLQNYPVQATISLYEDSEDEEDEDSDDEEDEKELS